MVLSSVSSNIDTCVTNACGPCLLQGALLAWSTDLAVLEAMSALQGALSEDMRGF